MKHMTTIRKFYTVKEVAEILNISDRTLQAWVSCGGVPFVRFGKKLVRFSEDNVAEIIRNGQNREYRYQAK